MSVALSTQAISASADPAASVLFVAPSAYVLGGLATWLDYLLPGLRARGWQAQLGLVSGPQHHRPERYLSVHPDPNVAIAHCATGTPEGRFRALRRLLKQAAPALVVSVNIPDVYLTVARLRQGQTSAPKVAMSVHGLQADLFADARRYADVLDGVICVNRLACELVAVLGGIEASRIFYAPCGADAPVAPAANRPRQRGDLLRIVHAGRIESAQKRVLDLIPIVQELRHRGVAFRLDIVGDGPDLAALRAQLSNQIAAGSVVIHGSLPTAKLITEIYPQCDVVLVTSQWETGPLVAWEAMAQGLVVVSSRYVGCGRESALRDQATARLFAIGDAHGAAAALAELWADPAQWAAISAQGRRLAVSNYSVAASVAQWDGALRQVLDAEPRPTASVAGRAAAGRLDKAVGPQVAETLRSLVRRRPPVTMEAGSEWAHSHSAVKSDGAFWAHAASLDQPIRNGLPQSPLAH